MKTFLYSLIVFLSFSCYAQVPEPTMLSLKTYGGDGVEQVTPTAIKTPDGGFIISISTNSDNGPITDTFCHLPSSSRIIFAKYNADASIREWSKCYKNNWSDTEYIFLFQTGDNKLVLAGNALSGRVWFIRKVDEAGNLIWKRGYTASGMQQLQSMITTDDGGYIMFGSAYSNDGDVGFHYGSLFSSDFWILKLDSLGNKVWSKVIGGTGDDFAKSVVAAPGGGCYITGQTQSNDNDCIGNHGWTDLYLARLDVNGNILWHKDLGGDLDEGGGELWGASAVADGNGGLFITTASQSDNGDVLHHINFGGYNIWAIDVDSAGNTIWSNCYGGDGCESSNSICRATDGTIWIMGSSQGGGGEVNNTYYGGIDAFVVHADNDGNFLSSNVLSSNQTDDGYMIYGLAGGSVIAGGYFCAGNGSFSNSFNGGSCDAFLATFSPQINAVQNIRSTYNSKLYPNPAVDIVYIECKTNGKSVLTICDVIGRPLYTADFTGKDEINLKDWKAGIYYVQIVGDDGYREVQKLIIQ